ncbi:hypothetical protein Vadar_029606 [Vaccinium darrowii]|uniref:Uncharacterized protein n=1 Tax=Vaccinium darrowii TaxID=229202 RepID=A0ACB7XD92_9ERIC|nr:hypothetical protein Vadar_029606 [Vaccinium darrowii]
MAASGLPVSSSSGPNPPLQRAPSRNLSFQRTPSRRVLFPTPKRHSRNWESGHESNNIPEMPPKHQARKWDEDKLSEITTKHEADDWDSNDEKRERRGRRLCCAWTSLIIGCLVLALMLLGALSLYFINGALPEFSIKSMNISRLDISSKDERTLLSADVQLLINATNKNDGYDLSYSALTVEVSSEDINLGTTEVAAFKQNPKKVSELKVSTGVRKSAVDDAAVEDLKSNYKVRQVVIDVVFKGRISLNIEGHELNGLPMKVLCTSIEQNVIDTTDEILEAVPGCQFYFFIPTPVYYPTYPPLSSLSPLWILRRIAKFNHPQAFH